MVINIVDISGTPVDLVGETVAVLSGNIHVMSGRIEVQSGVYVVPQSGAHVMVQSGANVVVQSGLHLASGGQILGRVIQTDGETDISLVDMTNLNVRDLLEEILKELKKQSLQLNIDTRLNFYPT